MVQAATFSAAMLTGLLGREVTEPDAHRESLNGMNHGGGGFQAIASSMLEATSLVQTWKTKEPAAWHAPLLPPPPPPFKLNAHKV